MIIMINLIIVIVIAMAKLRIKSPGCNVLNQLLCYGLLLIVKLLYTFTELGLLQEEEYRFYRVS